MKRLGISIALCIVVASACANITTPPPGAPPATQPGYCPDLVNAEATADNVAPADLPYQGLSPTVKILICPLVDDWTYFSCAVCTRADGGPGMLPDPSGNGAFDRCEQDTARTGAATATGYVICVASCLDPNCHSR